MPGIAPVMVYTFSEPPLQSAVVIAETFDFLFLELSKLGFLSTGCRRAGVFENLCGLETKRATEVFKHSGGPSSYLGERLSKASVKPGLAKSLLVFQPSFKPR
ncbi:MAG: hypothetical protein GY875_15720 [Gammaproteobacteria bacterium]|nr:hypothetical protein [Gammaproteobacteria bacterium]